jgi:succinyl-CoA:acetate CoA-transferase
MRVKNEVLKKKIMSSKDAAKFVKSDYTIGISGFTPTGYPKEIPKEIAKLENVKNLKIFSGASVGFEVDDLLVKNSQIAFRAPYQTNGVMRNAINSGEVNFLDMHLSHFPQYLEAGFLGEIDIAIIEGVMIDEEMNFYPSLSVGIIPQIIKKAKKILIEINESIPTEIIGMHDIYEVGLPPYRKPINITNVNDKIGRAFIPLDPTKVLGIVITKSSDDNRPFKDPDNQTKAISKHIVRFLRNEIELGKIPLELLPIQSGVGVLANSILDGLNDLGIKGINAYTEVIQDSMLSLIDNGILNHCSGTSLTLSKEGYERFKSNIHKYKNRIILRPQEITNSPEVIRRLGVISINTALEIDIYGHINSTQTNNGCIMNGIGGSGDFARNAYITIFTAKSTYSKNNLSSIVLKVAHVDHTEHDVDIVVTENGIADLRGLSPSMRAREIIENCAHENHKIELLENFTKYLNVNKCKHEPS